ncbi:hypothetical protein CHS0354_007503 [Potamilus streckersoni]|uniref:Uncharacterized protein n=1 Tax=Potamilus streckersoni TaxID=2493646 RepID=A0AAE0T7W7_9BIVA|nr:hypothetical protein CHS0354_007503 [Potamilus streckersoni]
MFIETASMKKNTNHYKTEKCLKRSGFKRDMENVSKKIRGQNDINPKFKSPLENQMQSRHKQKGTLEERSDKIQVDSMSKRVSTLETPALDLQITNKEESETTPLMDEGLQKLTLQEASRAPNKRKSSNYKANSDSQANRYEDMKERVTKSLMRKRSSSVSKAEVAQIGEKGDARIKETDDSAISGKCKKFINSSAHKESSYAISKSQVKDAKTACEMKLDGDLMNSDDDADFEDFNTYDSALCSPYFREFPSNSSMFGTIIRHSGYEIDSPLLVDESGDKITEPVEVEVGLSNKQCERNDALENAIARLRRMVTLNNNPEVSSLSVDSSPKLQSPALSGISELSSLSSESNLSSKMQDSSHDQIEQQVTNGKITTETQRPLETPCEASFQDVHLRNHILVNQDDLCTMFREVTPEGKKSRLKGGRRLVASSKVQSNSNFKDLFNSDEIF